MIQKRSPQMSNKQNYPINSIKLQESRTVTNNQIIRHQTVLSSREKSHLILKNDNFIGNMSNISQKITKQTQITNSEDILKIRSPSLHHEIQKYEQKIVYFNNKAFIISNSPAKAPNSQSKVICLNSKSKNKNKLNNSKVIQQQSNIRYDSIVQRIPNQEQCLQRKISILQNRIKQIQGQKQQIYLSLSQQIKKLSNEKHNHINRINQLEQKLSLICEKYENKQVEICQLYKKLQVQRLQKQKTRQKINYEATAQNSINTNNFINLTLTQEVQTLQRENKTLKNELQALKQSIKTNICSVAQTPPSLQEAKIINVVQAKQSNIQPCARVLEQSKEIMQIDSEILNIEQLISSIGQISDENKKLKQQVQQSKNQLQIKQALAVQTARIVQAIKNQVQHSILANQCYLKQDNIEGCACKNSLKNIKEILTQIYEN